jgi:hypothetical protein
MAVGTETVPKERRGEQDQQEIEENPMVAFMYSIKAPETRRQYPR